MAYGFIYRGQGHYSVFCFVSHIGIVNNESKANNPFTLF